MPSLATCDVPVLPKMFHVALLVADSEPAKAAPQDLPKGVQKAIADIRDFLPFKSYRVVTPNQK